MSIYYEGLCGSRLCNADFADSDWDYIILTDSRNDSINEDRKTNQFQHQDKFYIDVNQFCQSLFVDITAFRRFNTSAYLVEQLFSDPVLDNEFTQWLVAHRQEIFDANRSLFADTMLRQAKNMILCPYKSSLKLLMRARKYLYWYIEYAKHPGDFLAIRALSPEEKQYLTDVKMMKIPFEQVLFDLKNLLDEAYTYNNFWYGFRDDKKLQELETEMKSLFHLTY